MYYKNRGDAGTICAISRDGPGLVKDNEAGLSLYWPDFGLTLVIKARVIVRERMARCIIGGFPLQR